MAAKKGTVKLFKDNSGVRKSLTHLPAVLMLGIVSQFGQVLFMRELLMVFQGNELFIGLILAFWLVWVGTGSRLGGVLADRSRSPVPALSFSSAAILLLLPAVILFIRSLRGILGVPPGAYLSLADIIISCALLMAPVCLLLGMQFVLLSRLWRESEGSPDTSGAGKTYVGEASGNVLGGILFTFIAVRYFNSFETAVAAAIVMLAAVMLFALGHPGSRKIGSVVAVLIVLGLFSLPFMENIDSLADSIKWHYYSPEHQLEETYTSVYGDIAVLQREEQYSFYQSGQLMFSIAGPEALTPGLEEQEAVEFAHLSMVQHKEPERVLLIGGGLRGTLAEILKHPVGEIDYLELDEELVEAARPYLSDSARGALEDPRVNLVHTDGRMFVKDVQEKYDMVIVDAPDPLTAALNRYYTREFFTEVREILCPDGVLVTGAESTADLRGKAIANRNATLYHTLSDVFPRVLPAGERFMYLFASGQDGDISVDPTELGERYLERDIDSESFSAQHYHSLLEDSQLRRVNWVVRNHGRTAEAHLEGPDTGPVIPATVEEQQKAQEDLPPVEGQYFINSDFKPIAYYYTVMFMDDLARGRGYGEFFDTLLQVRLWWFALLFLIPVLSFLILLKTGTNMREDTGPRWSVLYTVFTTGFSTMTMQIALIFSFQGVYGFIYEMVGLIIAMFMAGLALGASLVNRFVKNKTSINLLAAVQLTIGALALVIAAVLPLAGAIQSASVIFVLFSLVTFVSGITNGVDFPLSAACCMAARQNPERSTGAVYGIELFGACAGAVLASAVLAPVLGIPASFLVAGMANGSAFIVLLTWRRSYLWLTKKHSTGN